MIPPLTQEEFERLVPVWAQELAWKGCPLAPGLPVYDILYGTKYRANPFGLVIDVIWEDLMGVVIEERVPGTLDRKIPGWKTICLAAYHVPDVTHPVGVEHVRRWKLNDLPPLIMPIQNPNVVPLSRLLELHDDSVRAGHGICLGCYQRERLSTSSGRLAQSRPYSHPNCGNVRATHVFSAVQGIPA